MEFKDESKSRSDIEREIAAHQRTLFWFDVVEFGTILCVAVVAIALLTAH